MDTPKAMFQWSDMSRFKMPMLVKRKWRCRLLTCDRHPRRRKPPHNIRHKRESMPSPISVRDDEGCQSRQREEGDGRHADECELVGASSERLPSCAGEEDEARQKYACEYHKLDEVEDVHDRRKYGKSSELVG